MRLTDHTDYSLRVLMYLNQTKRLITLSELSEKIGVSRNNLIKASNQLAKLGFVESIKGRSGGLVIGKDAGKRTLREIVSHTEETMIMADCFQAKNCECAFFPKCPLKRSLALALDAFLVSLGKTTLDDVTPKQTI